MVMMTNDCKRSRDGPPAAFKNTLTNDLRSIARIDMTNVLNGIRKMDKNTSPFHNRPLTYDYYFLFILAPNEYTYIYLYLITSMCVDRFSKGSNCDPRLYDISLCY